MAAYRGLNSVLREICDNAYLYMKIQPDSWSIVMRIIIPGQVPLASILYYGLSKSKAEYKCRELISNCNFSCISFELTPCVEMFEDVLLKTEKDSTDTCISGTLCTSGTSILSCLVEEKSSDDSGSVSESTFMFAVTILGVTLVGSALYHKTISSSLRLQALECKTRQA